MEVVISNDPAAKALKVAERHRVPSVAVIPSGEGREQHDRKLDAALRAHGVVGPKRLILLAGYMRVLSRGFVERHAGHMMNIHPSLLPSFPGLDAQAQALSYGAKVAGCTVHFVVPEVDAGPIIAQKIVPVEEGDTESTLSARILKQEHLLYPYAVKLFVEGRIRVEGRRVRVRA